MSLAGREQLSYGQGSVGVAELRGMRLAFARGMTVEGMTLLAGLYIVGTVIISLVVAYRLDLRLKARVSGSRAYMWGFFFGCVCIGLCVPLTVASAVETARAFLLARWTACHLHGLCTVVFAVTAVCGWYMIRRRGWAWLLGSLLAPVCAFPVLQDLLGWMVPHVGLVGAVVWLINYVYGRSRWRRLQGAALTAAKEASKRAEASAGAGELGIGNCELPIAG